MIAGILIIAFSSVLFAYWFRYSCLLLLRNAEEQAGSIGDSRFNVARVIEELRTQAELAPLERALERDYHVLTYLLQHAADLELGTVEDRLLLIDYRLMRIWSSLTRTVAPAQSRKAVAEMASVLNVLVRKVGAQSGMQAEA